MKRAHRLSAILVLTTVGSFLTGCAQVHSGSVQRADGYDANTVNPALFDTGNYPTKPRAPIGTAGSVNVGRLVEAHRVAENTLLPFQADPTLNHADLPWVIATNRALADYLGNDAIATAVDSHNLIAGFQTRAKDNDDNTQTTKELSNTVVIFGSATDAAAAPTAITASDPPIDSYTKSPYPTTAITIPRHPESRAWAYQARRTDTSSWQIVEAFTARGPYLLAQQAKAQSPAAAADLIAATLDQQGPLIDGFTPTPPDQLASIPLDPSGLEARILLPANRDRTVENGVYGPHGALAFYSRPDEMQRRFTEAGVDLYGHEQSSVLRTRDAKAAGTLLNFTAMNYQRAGYEVTAVVNGLPGARCLRQREAYPGASRTIHCLAQADRYVIDVHAPQETNAKQMVAAQYLLLMST
ncbi:hypothetical protein MINS_28660 [Mycolicibacterium insubricum]|jgi:hypothetical protein|uniref:Uncharacterized protein n=1 Tax=Mycolicibacterium insubricum TaxID=444597 RepID=A0A1X0DNF4_9MYCO|nr:hypothetical protein [Mycolicibacterium insubricum]MCB9441828.1 hypothetical protein [Mycolicibacterium sp.]MCV7082158.1 hypothetical protein [Mycolicibacterium insubricum]ORA73847.1 hypothetical protein BST26_01355 [Mycolicibacterium insubricum]BBZ67437.1 hypothetical protein MINS_28660 [Mycolicibacterium insubricum]